MDQKDLIKRITAIENRNKAKELDKAWETSVTRMLSIAVLTYILVSLYMAYIQIEQPLLQAIIPTLGFVLSTLALRSIRKLWEN